MIRPCLLIVVLWFHFFQVEAQPLTDSSRNKIAGNFSLTISRNCPLSDSTNQELSNFVYDYLIKIKEIRSVYTDRLICAEKTALLRTGFERELEDKFGNCVYKNYKKINGGCVLPVRRKENMLNRITGRTRE